MVVGGLEPIPAVIGREALYTLDRSPRPSQGHTEANETTIHTHTHTHDTGMKSVGCSAVIGGQA